MLLRLLVVLYMLPIAVFAQVRPDPALLAEINAIKAIDNHAHPVPALPIGAVDDQMPVADSVPELGPPVLLRPSNPQWVEAWRSLYGYDAPHRPVNTAQIIAARNAIKREKGIGYPAWVLDK